MIATLINAHRPTHLVACWDDDWRPQWRVDLIPTYKTHRLTEGSDVVEESPDDLTPQVPLIRDALAALGIARLGAPGFEADDVIGTLVARHKGRLPIDVVTGDRDLFQLVDDARGIRVIYTGRGMSNLEVLDEASVTAKYRVLPSQYADYAVLRGDASDGLPGVAGIGEKTAATLLAAHGDLAGIHAAAEAGEGMTAGIRAKLLAAADYLTVAPTVVEVVRTLDLPDVDARLRTPDAAVTAALAADWNLGSSLDRAVTAISARS